MEQSVGTRRRATTDAGVTSKADESTSKADEAKEQVQEKAKEGVGQARERVREQVDQRSTQAGEQVRSSASDARAVAEELRRQGKDAPARYAEQAADRAERLGDYLRDADGDQILRDVERYARRNPWAVVAGGIALGFTASRLLKASSRERYRESTSKLQIASGTSRPAGNGSGADIPSGGLEPPVPR
jgi:ElaB/YqjD/DUF883 family membrane-anchored ribosome-binding protein